MDTGSLEQQTGKEELGKDDLSNSLISNNNWSNYDKIILASFRTNLHLKTGSRTSLKSIFTYQLLGGKVIEIQDDVDGTSKTEEPQKISGAVSESVERATLITEALKLYWSTVT